MDISAFIGVIVGGLITTGVTWLSSRLDRQARDQDRVAAQLDRLVSDAARNLGSADLEIRKANPLRFAVSAGDAQIEELRRLGPTWAQLATEISGLMFRWPAAEPDLRRVANFIVNMESHLQHLQASALGGHDFKDELTEFKTERDTVLACLDSLREVLSHSGPVVQGRQVTGTTANQGRTASQTP